MKNKSFIFDIDGVLVNTKKMHYETLNYSLSLIDKKYVINEEDQKNIFEGLTTNQKLKILTSTKGLPEHLHNHIWRTKQEESYKMLHKIKQDQELINIFKIIKKNNIKIGVASNSIRQSVEKILQNLGVIDLVDCYLSNEDINSPKPSPEIYKKCMDILGSTPELTTIFEDSYVGRLSAVQSNARLVEISNQNNLIQYIKNELDYKKKQLNVLIPMAGDGQRFKDAGYQTIKPMIMFNDKTMIQHVVENIGYDANYIFVIKKEDDSKHGITKHLSELKIKHKIILQESKLNGATQSALLCKELINNENPLLIANSDQYIVWNNKKTINDFIYSGVDGAILTFDAFDSKWSFVKHNSYNTVSQVAEKNIISNKATCGIYFWKSGSDFIKYAEQMISKKITVNGEYYICPVYNEAIEDEKIIISKDVYEMWGLGTPSDLEEFLKYHSL